MKLVELVGYSHKPLFLSLDRIDGFTPDKINEQQTIIFISREEYYVNNTYQEVIRRISNAQEF